MALGEETREPIREIQKPSFPEIECVDIMAVVEQFPGYQRKALLGETISLELTNWCTGHCPDCYLSVPRPNEIVGRAKAISYLSLERFFTLYGQELRKNFGLYYGNEPTDWHDGDKTIADLYRLVRKHFPETYVDLSTYFPQDRDDVFIDLMSSMIKDYQESNGNTKNYLNISLISNKEQQWEREKKIKEERLARIKATMETRLGPEYQKSIDIFFDVGDWNFGVYMPHDFHQRKLIGRAFLPKYQAGLFDPFKEIEGMSCADGVILSAEGFRGVQMDAVSPFNPNGEHHYPIIAGNRFKIPRYYHKLYFLNYYNMLKDGKESNFDKQILMPIVTTIVDEDGMLKEQYELPLSRAALVFRSFLEEIAKLKECGFDDKEYEENLKRLLQRARVEYEERKTPLEPHLEKTSPSPEEEYFIELNKLYLNLLDFVFSYIFTRIDDPGQYSNKMVFAVFDWANKVSREEIQAGDLEFQLAHALRKTWSGQAAEYDEIRPSTHIITYAK